jgi:hypothetical protein
MQIAKMRPGRGRVSRDIATTLGVSSGAGLGCWVYSSPRLLPLKIQRKLPTRKAVPGSRRLGISRAASILRPT